VNGQVDEDLSTQLFNVYLNSIENAFGAWYNNTPDDSYSVAVQQATVTTGLYRSQLASAIGQLSPQCTNLLAGLPSNPQLGALSSSALTAVINDIESVNIVSATGSAGSLNIGDPNVAGSNSGPYQFMTVANYFFGPSAPGTTLNAVTIGNAILLSSGFVTESSQNQDTTLLHEILHASGIGGATSDLSLAQYLGVTLPADIGQMNPLAQNTTASAAITTFLNNNCQNK
jgi:hypothetical protein